MTTEDAIQITNRARIVEQAKRQQIPVVSEFGDFAHEGALMTYGPNILDSFRSAAGYVDKVLNGVKPADSVPFSLSGMWSSRSLGLEGITLGARARGSEHERCRTGVRWRRVLRLP